MPRFKTNVSQFRTTYFPFFVAIDTYIFVDSAFIKISIYLTSKKIYRCYFFHFLFDVHPIILFFEFIKYNLPHLTRETCTYSTSPSPRLNVLSEEKCFLPFSFTCNYISRFANSNPYQRNGRYFFIGQKLFGMDDSAIFFTCTLKSNRLLIFWRNDSKVVVKICLREITVFFTTHQRLLSEALLALI